MEKIVLTSAQEAAFYACGEALSEIRRQTASPSLSITYDARFDSIPPFTVIGPAEPGGDYHLGKGDTLAEAARDWMAKVNDAIANPKPKPLDAAGMKEAVTKIVDEYRESDDGKTVFRPLLDEVADRIAALKVD
jgi:hypothetical protein